MRTCHAGVDEVLLPLWVDQRLVGVLFIGQFVRDNADNSVAGVSSVSERQIEHLLDLTLPLHSYLIDMWRRFETHRGSKDTGRINEIQSYIQEELAQGPTLTGLATRLGLSPSRASHVVRQVAQQPFRDLVKESRMIVAKDLLTNTNGTIAWVAHHVGFPDPGYFCRYFKTRTGMTPTQYRRSNQLESPI